MLNSDLPIKTNKEDMLNRASFAENLAKTLIDYSASEGFAIGLYGKWGSGKTSVINMVFEQLELMTNGLTDKPIVLRFNPWLCSDPKQLITQFFTQLSTAIKLKRPKLENVCNFINDYAEAFDLAEAIPIAGKLLGVIGKILGKKAKAYSEGKSNNLQKIKDLIISTLLKEKIKIIVAIDDVDRLSNQEIMSVFQLVKSLADFPNTIYLLAFDREVVVRALAEVQKGDGEEYLEKVIQVPFELPSPNLDDVYQVFFNKLDAIISNISNDKWDKEYWGMLFYFGIKHYFTSIRNVVRFANTFALKYALLKNDTYPIDLIGLTCLQIFEPEVYLKIQKHKDQLCGGVSLYYGYQKEKDKIQTAFDAIMDSVEEEKKAITENILAMLFPKLNILNNNFSGYHRQYNHYESLSNGGICCSDCFDRYFALMLEPNAISQKLINHLIFNASEGELLNSILELNSSKKTTRLIDHINASFQQTKITSEYLERAKLVLFCLIKLWHKLDDDTDDSFYSMSFSWRLIFTVETLLVIIPESERFIFISNLFYDNSVDLSTVEIILEFFENQHDRFIDSESKNREKLLTLDEVLSLENIFVSRVSGELESGTILDNNYAMSIIWLFEQIDPEKAKNLTNGMINSDLALAKFISAAVSHGKGMGNTVYRTWNVNREIIEKYVDIDVAYQKMSDFVYSEKFRALVDEKKQNIAAFLISVENKENEIEFHGGIILSTIEQKLKEIAV